VTEHLARGGADVAVLGGRLAEDVRLLEGGEDRHGLVPARERRDGAAQHQLGVQRARHERAHQRIQRRVGLQLVQRARRRRAHLLVGVTQARDHRRERGAGARRERAPRGGRFRGDSVEARGVQLLAHHLARGDDRGIPHGGRLVVQRRRERRHGLRVAQV